jgi:hypothetical protein
MPPELIDRVLDRGLVVEGWAGVSLLGIELLTIDTRAVVMSIETYLQYANAIGSTAVAARSESQPHPAQPTGVTESDSGQLHGGKQTQALFQPQRQQIVLEQQQQVQQWERQGQPKQPVGQRTQTLDDLQQQLVHAVQPILVARHQYLVHAVQSQLDPVFDMLCQRVRREAEAAVEQSRTTIWQEFAQAIEPVRATLRAELAQALKPVSVRLQQQVEQAFVGAPPSSHIS